MQISKRVIGVLLLLAACSHAPTQQRAQVDDRGEYSKLVRQDLQNWEKRETKLEPSRAQDLRAMVADTRAELNRLESAPDYNWRTFKPKIEDRLARIQNGFGPAK